MLGLFLASSCEQFNGHIDPEPDPGPGPGPDPDPDPDPVPNPPERTIVLTPATEPVPLGTTVTISFTGDPITAGETITLSLDPSLAVEAELPDPALFASIEEQFPPFTIDSTTTIAPQYRFTVTGEYSLTITETGPDYDPVVRTRSILVDSPDGNPGLLRAEATEVTGYTPPPGFANPWRGVSMGVNGLAVMPGGAGESDLLVLFYRVQTNPDASDNVTTSAVVQLGHALSGLWADPVPASDHVDDIKVQPASASEKLIDTGASVLQRYVVAAAAGVVHLSWTDNANNLIYKRGTLTIADGLPSLVLGDRTILEADSNYRVVPVTPPEQPQNALLVCTSGTINAEESLVLYGVGGTVTRQTADITRSSSDSSRIVAHDAAMVPPTLLFVAYQENGGPFDPGIDLNIAELEGANIGNTYTLAPGLDHATPAALAVDPVNGLYIAYLDGPGARVGLIDRVGFTGLPLDIDPIEGTVIGQIDLLAASDGNLYCSVQDTTGSIFETIDGDLRLLTLTQTLPDPPVLVATDPVPGSRLETLDNGAAALVESADAIHILWQENGIGLNRNSRILENRSQ